MFQINSINTFVICKAEGTGCQAVCDIKRYKTTNVVSVVHPAKKNNNMGWQERKKAVGKSELMPMQH